MCTISFFAGCATTEVGKDIDAEQGVGAPEQQAGSAAAGGTLDPSTTTPLGKESELKLDALHDPESPLSIRVIYFEFAAFEFFDISSHGFVQQDIALSFRTVSPFGTVEDV